MEAQTETPRGHTSTTVIAVLTLIVSVVSAIPGFLGLNKEEARIFFAAETTGIKIPVYADQTRIRDVLAKNDIPSDYLSVSLINQGNREAANVRIAMSVPGKIMAAWSDPPATAKPIWVHLPDLSQARGQEKIQTELKNFATTKPVTINLGFRRNRDADTTVEIFTDGKPAVKTESIAKVAPWSPMRVFRIPLIVLGVGLIVVILWAIGVVLLNNPKMQAELKQLAIKSATEVLQGIFPLGRF